MSVFDDFDMLRGSVNRMLNEFGNGLGGYAGGRSRSGRGRYGGGWGGGFGFPSLGGGLWDEDVFDMPLLTSGFITGGDVGGQGQQQGQAQLQTGAKGVEEETKMEDVATTTGGQQQAQQGGTQLQKAQAGHLQPTFRPDQILRARINVEDQKDKYVVTADVPGFDKEQIKVNLTDDGLLSIKAEQTQEWRDQSKDKKYLRAERSFSNIHRSLRVPKGVDTSKISASYENGVLHVNLPKSEERQKQEQPIQIS